MPRTLKTFDNTTKTIERVPVYFATEEYNGYHIHYNDNEPTYKWSVVKDGLVWSFRTRKATRAKVDEVLPDEVAAIVGSKGKVA
jgi:hypothetical protein